MRVYVQQTDRQGNVIEVSGRMHSFFPMRRFVERCKKIDGRPGYVTDLALLDKTGTRIALRTIDLR